jgi:hypothetical protein
MSATTETAVVDVRYPTGKFVVPETVGRERREELIGIVAALPQELRAAVNGLSDAQLETTYREGGWTVRQLVHHVADSHMNAYCRIRLALTEDWPPIKPYQEALWAELEDARTLPIEVSLQILDGLHVRLTTLFHSLDETQWQRGMIHAEWGKLRVDQIVAMYSWHGRHHATHVTNLRKRKGW